MIDSQAACAHATLSHKTIHYENGTCSDSWFCSGCNHSFSIAALVPVATGETGQLPKLRGVIDGLPHERYSNQIGTETICRPECLHCQLTKVLEADIRTLAAQPTGTLTNPLSESDVRNAVESALECYASGDGRNETQKLNYEYLTRVLNDKAEQNCESTSLVELIEKWEGYVKYRRKSNLAQHKTEYGVGVTNQMKDCAQELRAAQPAGTPGHRIIFASAEDQQRAATILAKHGSGTPEQLLREGLNKEIDAWRTMEYCDCPCTYCQAVRQFVERLTKLLAER